MPLSTEEDDNNDADDAEEARLLPLANEYAADRPPGNEPVAAKVEEYTADKPPDSGPTLVVGYTAERPPGRVLETAPKLPPPPPPAA